MQHRGPDPAYVAEGPDRLVSTPGVRAAAFARSFYVQMAPRHALDDGAVLAASAIFLAGVSLFDVVSFAGAAVVLAAGATASALIPARRASIPWTHCDAISAEISARSRVIFGNSAGAGASADPGTPAVPDPDRGTHCAGDRAVKCSPLPRCARTLRS